ncbi:branched-chain amino acid ABC transporter permease [Azospirillum brasilense]|uniref:Branched-chain amino acid ABC transporter permease n=1 Tax=Azospirillum brasilense TaxID=192 RepID=A0A235HAA7_AZOBR|nr:branched-chain amino acid ABC transporter permease [Azospirillum brasilense]OYD82443.1 branched-chain amino acid ABC transporter permease [Azospirillum brasilense]
MVQFFSDVLIRTVDLALIAVGLSCVYSLIRFPNIALVQYAVAGSFLALLLQGAGLPLPVAGLLACLLVGSLAVLLNVTVFERLLASGSAIAMVGSLAVTMILSAVFLVVFGPDSRRFDLDSHPVIRVLDARLTVHQLTAVGLTAGAVIVLALLLFRTTLGRSMRATATNRVLAAATGIDARLITNTVVFLSGVLAALGGIGLALKGEMNIQLGMDVLLPVFAAAILGGLGNALGAVAGAVIIATAETLVTNVNLGPLVGEPLLFLPASYATAMSFLILVAALLVRPHGLFVSEVKRV